MCRMILIPYARLEGKTRLPASEVAERMRQFLQEPPPPEVPPSLLPMWGKRYSGRVDDKDFLLTALSKFRQGYLPSFKGNLVVEDGHTRVVGVVEASPTEVATLAVGVLVLAGFLRSGVVVGMGLAVHVLAYLFGFLPHRNAFHAWLEGLPEWEWSRRTSG